MQPSTWNDTNQHWIPQFLLKGFGIRKNASSVYELDKQTKAIAVRKVSKAASKTHLLTERDDELIRGIESRAAVAIDAIRKEHLNRIDENARQSVDRLVCAMIMNDPHSGFDAEATRKEAIAEVISELSDIVNRYGGTLDETDFRGFFDERFHHDWVSNFMESTINQVLLSLRLMGLLVFRPTDGDFFIIGDSPVLVIRNVMDGARSLLNPGSQVILPIGSTCVLAYTWATDMNMIGDGGIFDAEQLRLLNSDYFHGTNSRYIYGRDKKILERSRLLPLKWTPRERSNEVKDGWIMMQRLQQVAQKQQEERDMALSKMLDYGARELMGIAIAQAAVSDKRGE